MTDETPEDWVLLEATKRGRWPSSYRLEFLREAYHSLCNPMFRALCDMIAKHEQKPVDRKLLCAREACAGVYKTMAGSYQSGVYDNLSGVKSAVRAIELWEQGFGK